MNVRQEIAIGVQCQFTMPEFYLLNNLEAGQAEELITIPGWVCREDLILYAPDFNVNQHYYFDGAFRHPIITIDDQYLFAKKQGGRINSNLVTMFPGELQLPDLTPLQKYLQQEGFLGYLTITFAAYSAGLVYSGLSLGIDETFLPNVLSLYGMGSDWFLAGLVKNDLPDPKGLSVSCRLYGNPYDPSYNHVLLDNFNIAGAIPLEDSYIVHHHQPEFHIKDSWKALYRQISDPGITHNNICYNTDGGYKASKVYDILKKKSLLK